MDRVLEPEVMDELDQVRAYARANFEQENQGFVDQFIKYFPDMADGHIVDLGCGPADIPIRLARVLPLCRITGVDASQPMLDVGTQAVKAAGLADRITLRCERLQSFRLTEPCDAGISNSVLHHLVNHLHLKVLLSILLVVVVLSSRMIIID